MDQSNSLSAAEHFEAELLKQEANPACGPPFCPVYASRKSFGAVFPWDSGSCPRCRQHLGLGGRLDLSIQFFRWVFEISFSKGLSIPFDGAARSMVDFPGLG
jgi:hypothetical protein